MKVAIIGAGFGGLNAARALKGADVEVTLVDRNNFHTFQPLLYQVATSGLNAADVAHPVRGVFWKQPNVTFRNASVTGVDWDEQVLTLDDGDPVAFNGLIVAAGAGTNYFGVPGRFGAQLPSLLPGRRPDPAQPSALAGRMGPRPPRAGRGRA